MSQSAAAKPAPTAQRPRALRRLAAMVYETFPLFAVAFFAALPALLITGGQAVPVAHTAFRIWLLAVIGAYFVICWLRGGQTVGAKAWRLRVVNAEDGRPLTTGQAIRRYLVALFGWVPLGLGHWWGFFNAERRGWHDLVAGTRLVQLPKAEKSNQK